MARKARSQTGPPEGTRDRLVRAAIAIATSEGLAAVTTVSVCQRVGIAQSSYYTHFASREELIEAIGEISAEALRRASRDARLRFVERRDIASLRDSMRAPLGVIGSQPELFRLSRQAQAAPPSTVMGAHGRAVAETNRRLLADDMMEMDGVGDRAGDPVLRRRYEMVADCIDAMVAVLGEGILQGRYPDPEEAVDLLTIYGAGSPHLARWLAGPDPDPHRTDGAGR